MPNHKDHVALFTLSGEGMLEAAGARWELEADTVMMVPARVPVRFQAGPGSWEFAWFYLDATSQRWAAFSDLGVRRRMTTSGAAICQSLLRVIDEHAFPHLNFGMSQRIIDLASDLCVTELELALDPRHELREDAWHARLDALWGRVARELGRAWTVERLAREVNLSYSTFLRYHEKYFGEHPKSRLTSIRMKHAQLLLRQGDLPIKAVSAMVGFQHPFAFTHAYGKHFGRSPSAERAEARS
ncbi:helix-turn-helix transcriptional regulator [Nibricoccus sp. IMCC34717]|uniref:helix-turn-helix transcriptional regulator n=1 Tax=Nibricoccus sp. IMCC34717 TaxID=3034021 RepID=UPI00384FC647